MSKRIGFIGLFLIMIISAKSQIKLNFPEVDRKSYELFQEKKWNELIQFSSEARTQGIDFFYLQVRTGIAWYNQGKYRNSIRWFKEAYSNDKSFDWLQEYLYYSLVYSGQKLEAMKYAPDFSEAVKKKIGFKEKGITRLAFESGYCINPDFEDLKTRSFSSLFNLGGDYGEGYFLKNYSFYSFDLSQRISPKLTLSHNLTYIGVNREAVVDWSGQTNSPIRTNQFNYYINPIWIIGKKLNISPSLNVIFGEGDVYAGFLNGNSKKAFSIKRENFSDAVLSATVWSDFGNISPGFEANTGTINDSEFMQISSWITFFPLSNNRLYITPRIYFRSGDSLSKLSYNAFSISGGKQIGSFFIYGQYLFGQMENFVESAGYLISNFPGKSDRKIMASVYFPVGKKYQFVLRYINQNVIEKYQVYSNGIKSNSLEYNYLKNTITGGISWNF